jgi:long-chain fatty acid transport protein
MRKLILALVAAALIAPMALAQIDFNIMGTGARARAMGGAFIGVADDATAVGWNPAGLAQLDKMEASAVGLFANYKYSAEWNFSGVTGSWETSVSHIAPAFASFIVPTKVSEKNLVFGVAYQRLIDMGYGEKDEGTWTGGTWNYEETQKGGVDAITPALAFQISPMFSLGAAGNILILGAKSEADLKWSDGDFWHSETDWKYSGFDMNFGALVTTPKFNIGASCRLPFDLKENGDYKYNESFGGVTGDTSYSYPENTYNFPLMLGFGVAFKPTDKLTLAGDFEMRQYSNTNREYTYNGVSYIDTLNWENCNQFRLGMEYIITGPSAVFPVRLGFRTSPRTYKGNTGTWSVPDTNQVVGKVFTGGFGLIMGSIMLDLAAEYGMTTIHDIEEGSNSFSSKEKNLNVLASIIYHFK